MAASGSGSGSELRRLARELAAADAPGVLHEARLSARARARALLEDALVDELLAAAARLEGSGSEAPAVVPRTAPAAVPRNATEPSGDAWWAYCVLRASDADTRSELRGVEPGTVVEAVLEGELAVLVSRVPLADYGDEQLREHLEDIGWLERTARDHEGVLEAALAQAAIVPLRLCTLFRDHDGVHRMLRENREALLDSLERVEGCAEWGIKVFLESDRPASEPPEDAGLPGTSGAEYLDGLQRERKAAARLDELCADCSEQVHGALSELAREAKLNPVQQPEAHGRAAEMILNAAYLVDHERVPHVRSRVSELVAEWEAHGLTVELTGPWPPYNFVAGAAGMMA